MRYRFNRLELAGSFGDLGTLLPLSIGMVMINGLDPMGLFFSIGVCYIFSGIYFGVTTPVQPMKVIGAYAIAMGISSTQISAAGLWLGLFLLIAGGTGLINLFHRLIPRAVIRGVQLSGGVLLMSQGVKFILGLSSFQKIQQAAEPFLSVQSLGPISVGIVTGILGCFLTFLLMENKKYPAGLMIVFFGMGAGLLLGGWKELDRIIIGLNFPKIFPFGLPGKADFVSALFILAIPQIPMTIGNAILAQADLSKAYFGADSKKVTPRALGLGMGLMNLFGFAVGGMPLCYGAGGLAAHYRFGARTAGSNLLIGSFFILLALFLGAHSLIFLRLIPLSVLGVLLLFAGSQLSLTILDIDKKKDLFVCLMVLGITLATNLAGGFIVGIILAYAMRSERLNI